MLSVNTLTHTEPESSYQVQSRKLTIDNDRHIILLIASPEAQLTKTLEENMLEILAGLTWSGRDMGSDFSFVMERYNKFLYTLSKTTPLTDIHMCLGVTMKHTLMFSTIGDIDTKLVERGGRITDIGESITGGRTEFTNISSGEVPFDSAVFVSTTSLLSIFSRDDLDEMAHMEEEKFETVGADLLSRESHGNLDIIRIATERLEMEKKSAFLEKGSKQLDIARGHVVRAFDTVRNHPLTGKITKPLVDIHEAHPRQIQMGIFILGVAFCIGLLWILFHNIFTVTQVTPADDKNRLIQVTTLIQKAQKDTANKAMFNKDITEAEALLKDLRENPQFTKSVNELTDKIVALKKEVNGVETANMMSKPSLIPFPQTGFTLVRVFASEKSGFSYAIGREGMIGPYTANATSAKVIPYPPGELAKNAEISAEGVIYIIMESGHIYTQPLGKTDLVKVNISGQDAWENADMIKSFDSKLYLVKKSPVEIFRHTARPNTTFSAKSTLFAGSGITVTDIAIDGAVYLLTPEGRILKVIAGQNATQTGITLNGIPGEYKITPDSHIFVQPNLKYFYIISGKNIWIFQPESRNFRDLKSLTYVAQMEVSTNDPIITTDVPRDGQILIGTAKGIYPLNFQISDGKIVLDGAPL